MKEPPPFIRRKTPTYASAQIAAYAICKEPIDLAGRKPIEGFAIDSADPDTPMDRDDAIDIEHKTDPVHGKVTVLHVTIADVASSCPRGAHRETNDKLATLDKEAHTNGETLYFSYGVAPMLPRRLQDRLSLENGKERPGVTISVTFNQNADVVHTEFARTVIRAKCKSYQDAVKDIAVHGNPLQQLSVLAKHILQQKSTATDLPYYDASTGMYTDSEGNTRHINIDELNAYMTVQGCMIAANEASSGIMRDSNFLFRNHSYTAKHIPQSMFYSKSALEGSGADVRKVIQNKAEYNPECKGHYGLNARMYSHVTSPIRRYADLVNQRMIHWSIDVVDAAVDQIMADKRHASDAWDRERIAHHVWQHATQLLGDAAEFRETRGGIKKVVGKRLEETIAEIADAVPGVGRVTSIEIAKKTLAAIDAIELPYSKKELTNVATDLNRTLEKNRLQRREIGYSETEAWLNAVFPETDSKKLLSWSPGSFARLLEAAARRGDNNEIFAKEVLKRLDSPSDKDALVQNLHTLLVVSERYKDGHWQMLKKQAFQRIKSDPTLGEKVFTFMQGRHETDTYILEATLLDDNKQPYPAALVVLSNNGGDYSAPIIDTADTPEHAKQAAILTFFRHYGDLYHHDALYTPKLIDLALERARVKRGSRFETLKKICGENFSVTEQYEFDGAAEHSDHNASITLTVASKETGEKLIKTRRGRHEQARDKAAKDILEDRRFHDMLSQCHGGMHLDDERLKPGTELPEALWAHSSRIIQRTQDDQQR
jgi:hypothetical protein